MTNPLVTKVQQLVRDRQIHAEALAGLDESLSGMKALLAGQPSVPAGATEPSAPKAAVRGKSGRRPRRRGASDARTLADYLEAVIKSSGNPVSIGELIAGVTAAGYHSKSKNLRPIVSLSLIKDKRFKRVDRGVYTLRGGMPHTAL